MNRLCLSLDKSIVHPTAVLEAYIPELRRFARALLRGDRESADDLLQDSLERALSRWHQRRGDLRGWIYTIVYNRFVTSRRRRFGQESLTEVLVEDLPGIDGGQEAAVMYRDLLRGFAELPDEQRAVLLLIGLEDFSYNEAARVLGVPIGTVMSRLARGRERLRQYINGERELAGRHPTRGEQVARGPGQSSPAPPSAPPTRRIHNGLSRVASSRPAAAVVINVLGQPVSAAPAST